MTLDDRKIFPDIFHPVSLPTEEPLWVLFDWSAISLDIQLRSVPYFTTNIDLEKCFLKPHSSKTQIALVTKPGPGRRRWTAPPRQAVAVGAAKIPALHSLISEISDADALSLSLPARSFELPGFLCSWLVMVVAEA